MDLNKEDSQRKVMHKWLEMAEKSINMTISLIYSNFVQQR